MTDLMLIIMTMFLLVFCLIFLAFAIVTYILNGFALSEIATRRGVRNPWMAWVPIVNYYLLGAISDDYQLKVKGVKKNRAVILLIGAIVMSVLSGFYGGLSGLSGVVETSGDEVLMLVFSMIILLVYFVFNGVSIGYAVLQAFALYDVFSSTRPEKRWLFTILGVILGIYPIFLYMVRKEDSGMPVEAVENVEAVEAVEV